MSGSNFSLAKIFTSRLMRGAIGAVFAATMLLQGGCATQSENTGGIHLVWPAAPQKPRIIWVKSLRGKKSFEGESTKNDLVKFLTGKAPPEDRVVEPMGLALSNDGTRLYVTDFVQSALYEFDFADHKFVNLTKGHPLAQPLGVAVGPNNNIYVVEAQKKGIQVLNPQGKEIGFITDSSIHRPTGVAIDQKRKRIYLVDTGHTQDKSMTVKIFTLKGQLIGQIGHDKGEAHGEFLYPTYVAVGKNGNVYVSDTLNSRVQEFKPDGEFVRKFGARGSGWGMFDKPKGVALDSFGNLYVVDSGWSNVQIFNKKGQILLFFGGRGAIPGMLKNPTSIVISKKNTIYVGDNINHRIEVYHLVNTKASDSFLKLPKKAGG